MDRFYKEVSVGETETGEFQLLLDGRTVKTPGRNVLALPNRDLGEAVAEEWRAQGKQILPETMPMTRLVNTAIDGVRDNEAAVADDIATFAGTDLLCYRADGPDGLVAMQGEAWDPALRWAEGRVGGTFHLSEGVMHVDQPDETMAGIQSLLSGFTPFELTALHIMTSLTGSAVLALAVAEGELSTEDAWGAAHVDEDWQISQWGEDKEASDRRAKRKDDFDTAARMMALVRN
ncbi:ATP12 family chaperone protein [Methyloligella halotolerans]|uniref:ATP12 family chaperone protein n=1 Tax=Methyloligella halotolerans TaxID=1177755 RepID=UPI00083E1E2C|nr:ATP12 family protein [Methyloligella halotolerans]